MRDVVSKEGANVVTRSRAREVYVCVRYGLMPWWTYEDEPHYAEAGWSAGYHWWVNLRLLGRLLTRREV